MNLPLLSAEDFEKVVKEDKKTCIIVFAKATCNVCARLKPTIEKIAKDYEKSDELSFYSMDVLEEHSRKIFKSWQLVGVPQTVFIKNGEFQEALPGALDEKILRKEIEDMLHPKPSFAQRLKNFFK